MDNKYSYKGKRDDWNKRENPYIKPVPLTQYPKKASRDKNMVMLAKLVYERPGGTRFSYGHDLPTEHINKRLFYANFDVAIRCGLLFMVNWRVYPSPEWDFDKWELANKS